MNIFKDKIVIITGGASGIGRALGEDLAHRGSHVILADRNVTLLDEVSESIIKTGFHVKPVKLDVSNFEAVKTIMNETINEYGRLDYIFNNAGIAVGGEARDYAYEDWSNVINTNLFGVVNGVAAAYPVMVKQGFGHIVNTASIGGLIPAGEISYVTSKHGIVGLSHQLRVEGADLGVKVSVICPGKIETPLWHTSKIIKEDPEKLRKLVPKGITPEECATVILRGVECNKATIMVTTTAKILWLLYRISPSLVFRLSRWIVNKRRRTVRIEE